MDMLEQRIAIHKKNAENENLKKLQESYVKQSEREFIGERMKRMKEYKYELKCKEIEDKEKRLELLKNQKDNFIEEKKKLNQEMQKEKLSLIDKFNKLVKGNTTIDSEIVKKLYPEDEELYLKIKEMQDRYKTNKNHNLTADCFDEDAKESKISFNENRIKSASQKKIEEEIEKKVESFRKKLREEIAKEIENERINEKQRIKEYEEATSVEDKKKIEQKNNIERNESNQKITHKNENIENYVEEYRNQLKKNYGIY
jgi:hypothetical protein